MPTFESFYPSSMLKIVKACVFNLNPGDTLILGNARFGSYLYYNGFYPWPKLETYAPYVLIFTAQIITPVPDFDFHTLSRYQIQLDKELSKWFQSYFPDMTSSAKVTINLLKNKIFYPIQIIKSNQ